MASKKDNLKSLFSNTRSRVIILFTAILLVIAVVVGYVKMKAASTGPLSSANVVNAPGSIQSIPGAINPTAQYAKLQQEQNINQAVKAQTSGGSAIPTIIQSKTLGQGVGVIGSKNGKSGVGFATLTREEQGGTQQSLWVQSLKDGNCSKKLLQKILSQGAQLSDIKAGCSCIQLKDNGYKLPQLEPICECKELKRAGFNARQLKDVGYSSARLRDCGFSACEQREAGFSTQDMKDGGFSDGELKGAGFSESDIAKASGLPEGITAANVRSAGCDSASLSKLRKAGVTASAIRRITGCSAENLKAGGYSANDLKDANFSAADLVKAGYSPEELKAGGYSARDLLNAGFSEDKLVKAGFTPAQIKAASAELPPGITAEDLKSAGCDVDALKLEKEAGVSSEQIKQHVGCSDQALKSAGFTDVGNPTLLTDAEIKAAGCDPDKLKTLLAAGVSSKKIKELNGCNAQALKNAGFNPKSLMDAGYTPAELLAAGFTNAQLENAGKGPAGLLASGRTADCNLEYLRKARAAGVSAQSIKSSFGCSSKSLKEAGYSAKDLKAAGFTAAELKNAGFMPTELKGAGFSPKELYDAGFSGSQLKSAGFGVKDLKDAGVPVDELKNLGYNAAQLKAAGATPEELIKAGFAVPKSEVAGLEPLKVAKVVPIPSAPGVLPVGQQTKVESSTQQLQAILEKQNQQAAEQKYQQKIQQRASEMLSAANQSIQEWEKVSTQSYTSGNEDEKGNAGTSAVAGAGEATGVRNEEAVVTGQEPRSVIKTGDILFAVMDTSVNSDEPGPILATIVSGKLKGAKLIGSFNLPANANKMVITFNTLSVPGAERTISISAFAIDPNTARTALSSRTNHHYMMRYGSLFASSFLQGFGNAIQTANTSVTIGGNGGGNNIAITSGIGQSTLENAVIGLATVGKAWGQQAQQLMSTPTTVQVYSGTGIGILFTQDVAIS